MFGGSESLFMEMGYSIFFHGYRCADTQNDTQNGSSSTYRHFCTTQFSSHYTQIFIMAERVFCFYLLGELLSPRFFQGKFSLYPQNDSACYSLISIWPWIEFNNNYFYSHWMTIITISTYHWYSSVRLIR